MKFIHAADIHINRKFKKISNPKIREEHQKGVFMIFKRIIELTKTEKADFLILAGDLFEDEYPTLNDLKYISDLFLLIPETSVIIVFGNHDPYFRGSPVFNFSFPKNVTIFDNSSLTKKEIKGVNFYGLSFMSGKDTGTVSLKDLRLSKDQKNVLMFHGNINNPKDSLSLNLEEILSAGFDYTALGHIHKHEFLKPNIAYSGSVDAFDHTETGPKGVIIGDLETRRFYHHDLGLHHAYDITVEVSETDTISSLEEKIKKEIKGNNFYNFKIIGKINPKWLNEKDFKSKVTLPDDYVHVKFETGLYYDREKLKIEHANDIIGKVITAFDNMKENKELKDQACDLILTKLLGDKDEN